MSEPVVLPFFSTLGHTKGFSRSKKRVSLLLGQNTNNTLALDRVKIDCRELGEIRHGTES